jgi:hypothetical protein
MPHGLRQGCQRSILAFAAGEPKALGGPSLAWSWGRSTGPSRRPAAAGAAAELPRHDGPTHRHRQVREATSHAANACGRLAGAELLTFANTEASIPDLKERIAKTIDFIKSLKPSQVDGTEDKEITIKFTSGERKFTGQLLLLNFSLPNFYFRYTTASHLSG